MATTTALSSTGKPLRRSSRVRENVQLTVSGVDSYRGPYREQVSTTIVSAHGCKYESRRDVFTNSRVTLEVSDATHGGKPTAVRGLVKYVVRPLDPSGFFETAIELEDPGNIWGIASPPTDWLPYCEGSVSRPVSTPMLKSVAFSKTLETPAIAPMQESPKGNGSSQQANPGSSAPVEVAEAEKSKTNGHKNEPSMDAGNSTRPVGQLMGELQREMEKTLVEAASAAVRDRAAATLEEVRTELKGELREEARRILAESAAAQASTWVEQSLKSLKHGMQEGAKTLHQQWVRKIESDLEVALAQMEERRREMDLIAADAGASAAERFEKSIEASRTEAVDRVVSRLKEQSMPVLGEAKETLAELVREQEALVAAISLSAEKSVERVEESCTAAAKQFEMIIQERLDAANEQLDRAIKQATNQALQNVRTASDQQEDEARTRLQGVLESVVAASLVELKQSASSTSGEFAAELANLSHNHLESVSEAISQLARGFANISKR